ncbi:hypothetical protein BD310DRAFT_920487 [Dichomitus squalens]|uniref:Uncharacterized protein n=1 Tax=Dichomitus squalens TaxID=114155 RepID=A0A4Q9Q425_9APHY|nr:hypothetical protein BD310DRAFT_920487 [Dichomitus squalens]
MPITPRPVSQTLLVHDQVCALSLGLPSADGDQNLRPRLTSSLWMHDVLRIELKRVDLLDLRQLRRSPAINIQTSAQLLSVLVGPVRKGSQPQCRRMRSVDLSDQPSIFRWLGGTTFIVYCGDSLGQA